MECVFCKIVEGVLPSHKVHEDDNFLAFLDIHPHAKGHTVIIPKTHVEFISDLDEQKSRELIPTIKRVIEKLSVLHPQGYNVGWNDGKVAGQVVPHLHVHIFPRYESDGGGSFHSIIKNPQVDVEEVIKEVKNGRWKLR